MSKILFGAAVVLALQTAPAPISLPVQNGDFEAPVEIVGSDPCGARAYRVPGWNMGAGSGVLQMTVPNPCDLPAPNGQQVAYAGYGSTFYQDTVIKASDLQAVYPSEGVYTLQFSVVGYFHSYPAGYYEAKLLLGTDPGHELCETAGWGTQSWRKVTLTCPSPKYLVFQRWPNNVPGIDYATFDPNAHLVISFTGQGWPMLFDDVSLTFEPQ